MGFKFNPFTSNFDLVEGQSPYWRDPVPTRGDLPSGVPDGSAINVLDEESIFVYDLATDEWHNTRLSLTQFTAVADAAGVTIDNLQTANVNDYRVNLHAASSTTPGGVSTTAQNFAGDKTFDNDVTVTGDLTVNGTTTTLNTQTLDVEDSNITINNNGNQASADANDAGLTIEMSDATDVVLGYDSTLASRMKLGDQGDEREVMTTSHSQTVTNKNMKSATNLLTGASVDSVIRETGNQATFTIPDSAVNDTFVLENETQTITNKTLDNTNDITVLDSNLTIQDNVDPTKQAQLQASGITTGTTRTYTLPDGDDTLIGETLSQTVTNKTMDADNNTFTNFRHGDEVDDPSSGVHGVTGNVVGDTDAQTLTNKTIDADSNTITNIEDADIKVGAAINAEKIADGSVTNTEFQYISTLTSDAQIQIDGKADRNLNNLTATSINQNLIGADAFRSLGSSGTPWLNAYVKNIQPGVGNSLLVRTDDSSAADNVATQVVTIKSGNKSAGTGNTGPVSVGSGDSAGGNSGNTIVQSGAAPSGTRGDVILDGNQVDVQTSKIVNVVDPTADQDAATKKYVDDNTSFVLGDLDQTVFSIANNQAVFADVTNVLFNNAQTRSAEIHYSVLIDATADLYESGQIQLVQKGASWEINQGNIVGDNSQILFDITSAGQLQYRSGNYAGFVSGTIKCRAITTSI